MGKGNSHHRGTNHQHGLPLIPVQGQDREQGLQEGDVEDSKVQTHREGDGIDQHGVVVEEEGEQGFAGGQRIHSVQHLNDHEDGKRHGRGGLGHVVAEHLAADFRELGRAVVPVRLEYMVRNS